MSDSRFHLRVMFSIYGKEFPWDCSLNWCAEPGQIDERITEFFLNAHDEARVAYDNETEARYVPIPIPGIHSLNGLEEIIRARFKEDFTIKQTERGDGSGEAVLSIHGVDKASWKKRLIGNPPRDGITPRGPSEYYDLMFIKP